MEEVIGQGPIITLPTNEDLIAKLRHKLQVYRQRLRKSRQDNPYRDPRSFTDAIYKIMVLAELLREGSVDTYTLSLKVIKWFNCIDPSDFNNACGVIEDYCLTEGNNVNFGGLGG